MTEAGVEQVATQITPLYSLLVQQIWSGLAAVNGGWLFLGQTSSTVRCRYLHYGEGYVKNGERAQNPSCAGAGGYKRQNLVHCDLLLRHGGKRQAVERDTWSRCRSLMGAGICTMRSRSPCGRAVRRAQRRTSGSGL